MLKTLFFLLKLALFIGAIIWLSEQEGSVRIEWLGYTINVHVGFFLAGLLCVILAAIFIYRVIRAFVDFPASLRYYNLVRNKDKGYKALAIGLTAVAAGDTKVALKQADKARNLLPDDHGLPLLLEAQAARLDGREDDANEKFAGLLENKDVSFLGVRGLLQASMDKGDYDSALTLACEALAQHPKQPWILRTVYDLEVRLRKWNAADATLKRALRAGAVEKAWACKERVAIALAVALEAEKEGLRNVAQSSYAQAQRLDSDNVQAVLLAAEYHNRQGQVKKAKALIQKAWKRGAHAALVDVWSDLMPEKDRGDALSRLKWYQRLITLNDENARVHVAAGLEALSASLWGEARTFFDKAEEIRPSKELYKAMSDLELKASGNEEAARDLLAKASDVPAERVWICRETGRIYEHWQPIALPHGSFNTIEWDYPIGSQDEGLLLGANAQNLNDDNVLLDSPSPKAA